jgi:RNA polymerase sigma-70 factor (ECF subfamily)
MDLTLQFQRNESDFIEACVRQERWAQQELYETYYGQLMGICLRYAIDEHEALDILHEGFLKIFRYIGKYEPGTSLQAWLRRIMINTAIDHFRKNSRRRTDDLTELRNVVSPQPGAISQMSEKEILDAIRELSPVYKMVFNMYVIEGFSHREISEKLGITESSSRSNLVKARSRLKQILVTKYGGDGR